MSPRHQTIGGISGLSTGRAGLNIMSILGYRSPSDRGYTEETEFFLFRDSPRVPLT